MKQTGQMGFEFGWLKRSDYFSLFDVMKSASLKLKCIHNTLNEFNPPDELRSVWDSQFEMLTKEAIKIKRPFSPGPVARLLTAKKPLSNHKELEISTGEANYHDYVVSYELLRKNNELIPSFKNCLRLKADSKNGYTLNGFDNKSVCGSLGVEITIITSDAKLLIAKRSEKCGYLRNLFMASIGESCHPRHDKGKVNGKYHFLEPTLTAKRGVSEELGKDILVEEIRFFTLGVHIPTMDPDLIGMVKVHNNSSDILSKLKTAVDKWELSEVRFIDFTPKSVLNFLKEVDIKKLTPAAPLCLIFSLLSSFEKKKILQLFDV